MVENTGLVLTRYRRRNEQLSESIWSSGLILHIHVESSFGEKPVFQNQKLFLANVLKYLLKMLTMYGISPALASSPPTILLS